VAVGAAEQLPLIAPVDGGAPWRLRDTRVTSRIITARHRIACHAGIVLGLVLTAMILADAAAAQSEKWQYHLLNPTPRDRMRPMSTDRPDRTESPYTVDAGHFQIEMDVFQYTHDREQDVRIERWQIAPMNLKIGLLNNIDFQLVLETYVDELMIDRDHDTRERRSGFGDVTARLKINLWGNDGGSTAFAMMPFIKFPTNQDRLGNTAVEGGVILPLAIELPFEFRTGIMTEFDFVRDVNGRSYHAEFINTMTIARDIVGGLGGYVEFFSQTSSRGGPWLGTFDVGLTYAITDDVQLDAGVNIGLTRTAKDINPFVGLSMRF
jgi:hypothetical protein